MNRVLFTSRTQLNRVLFTSRMQLSRVLFPSRTQLNRVLFTSRTQLNRVFFFTSRTQLSRVLFPSRTQLNLALFTSRTQLNRVLFYKQELNLAHDDNRLERQDPKGCLPLRRKSHPSLPCIFFYKQDAVELPPTSCVRWLHVSVFLTHCVSRGSEAGPDRPGQRF